MSAEFEAQILAEIRRTHAQLKRTPPSSTPAQGNGVHGWSMRLTIEEVDLLLAIVDERDDLKRRLLTDWEPDIGAVARIAARGAGTPADVVGYVTDRLIPEGLVPKAETTDEASARVSDRLAPKRAFPKPTDLRPHLDTLHDAARTLAGMSAGPATTAPPAGCPFHNVIHDCPLGGCPDASPREVSIPDLPKQGRAEKVTRELIEDVGREERETPPRPCPRCGHVLHGLNPGPCMVIISDGPDGPLYCACERVAPVTGRSA